jgi:DNA-directed RNA polymerase specialized sigma24 family protein
MDAETIRKRLADLDEAGRIRVLSRAIWLLTEKHNKLVKRVERNQKLLLQTKNVAVKSVELATAVAKAAIPGLFRRKRKKLKLTWYYVGARLTPRQQEVLSHLFEDGWSIAKTARYMRKHPKVIYEHRKAAEKRIKRFLATKGIRASDIGLGR